MHALALPGGELPLLPVRHEEDAVEEIIVRHRKAGQGHKRGMELFQVLVGGQHPRLGTLDYCDLTGAGHLPHQPLAQGKLQPQMGRHGPLAAEIEDQGLFAFVQAKVKGQIHLQVPGQKMDHVVEALPEADRGGEHLHHLGQESNALRGH